MQRILVVKLADIGDVLTATPALRALRMPSPTPTSPRWCHQTPRESWRDPH